MITIGADPELFAVKTNSGELIPACSYLRGSKEEPEALRKEGYAVQWDNVMVEFNIPPVQAGLNYGAKSYKYEFVRRIREGAGMAISRLAKHAKMKRSDIRIHTGSQFEIGRDFLESVGPRAMTFGCSPEYDGYSRGTALPPLPAGHHVWRSFDPDKSFRFAGGHIHIGYNNPDRVPHFVVAAFCDLFLFPECVVPGDDPARKQWYGQPGRFRPTPYGIEYRSPSCAWVVRAAGARSPAMESRLFRIPEEAARVAALVEAIPAPILATAYRAVSWDVLRENLLELVPTEEKRTAWFCNDALHHMRRAVESEWGEECARLANMCFSGSAVLTSQDARNSFRADLSDIIGWGGPDAPQEYAEDEE